MADRPPGRVSSVLTELATDPTTNDGMTAMMERASEFDSQLAAKLTGVALNPQARRRFEDTLDEMWATTGVPKESPEVIIGGGLHASIYAAVRVAQGHPKPLVLEAKDRAGGAFAVSRNDTFFLNSRNRPGELGTPGREEALNVLPGAPVQPADLSGQEYQPNSALAFSIRAALAMNAKVITGKRVTDANSTSVVLDDGKRVKTTRVIYATGLGEPRLPNEQDGKHLIDYMEFLAMLDKPFPFQGVKRVAVVGTGDSARTVIEALTGQGPNPGWTVASLDYIEQVDWYGLTAEQSTRQGWESCNRSRYKGIGRVLPREFGGKAQVRPINERASNTAIGYDGAYVDGARYDLVIWAAGFDAMDVDGMVEYSTGGRPVARMLESGVFVVGPASQLSVQPETNEASTQIPENSAALFRYADRTAAFAMHLPSFSLGSVTETQPVPAAKPKPKKVKRVKLNKSDPENWRPGDRLRYDGGSKTATVRSVSGQGEYLSVRIENESDGGADGREVNPSFWRYIA